MRRVGRVVLGVMLIGLAPLAVSSPASAAPVTFTYAGPPVPIPDGADLSGADPGAPALATIVVAGLPTSITDVDFRWDGTACSTTIGSTTVGLDHTFINDLEMKLTSPGGTTVMIVDNTDGDGHNMCQVILDDDAPGAPPIQTAVNSDAPFTGTWTPANPLSAFDGQNPNGSWTLSVQDFLLGDTGSIRAFSIIIDAVAPGPPSVTINQAVGQADPTNISPINFTAVFNQPVTGFATGDVTLGGTAGATTAVVTGGPTTYNVAVSGMTAQGTVIASIAAGVAQNASLVATTASTSTDNTVLWDNVAPTCTITATRRPGPSGKDEMDVTVRDTVGLASITNLSVTNGTLSITPSTPFAPGTTQAVVTAIKSVQGTSTKFSFTATDRAGNTRICT